MSTKKREVIWGGRIMGAKVRAETAREEAKKAVRAANRAEAEGVVGPHGRLWRASAAKPNDRPMPERLPLQDKGEHAVGRYSTAA